MSTEIKNVIYPHYLLIHLLKCLVVNCSYFHLAKLLIVDKILYILYLHELIDHYTYASYHVNH